MIILYSKFILCSKSCAFMWVADFWCLTMGFANLDTLRAFDRWGLCLTIIGELFTRGKIYSFLLIPDTYFLYHFNQSCDFLDVIPFIEPTKSNTKHSVDLQTMNSHPFNAMSPCICNVCAIAYQFHVSYVMNFIWTIQVMHHIMHFGQL